jgi:hypothetical protein
MDGVVADRRDGLQIKKCYDSPIVYFRGTYASTNDSPPDPTVGARERFASFRHLG